MYLRTLLIVVSVVFAGRVANGQVTVSFVSLEARIAEADLVLRGTITRLSRKVIVPAGGKLEDGTPWPDGKVEFTLTVTANEVLKGEAGNEIQLNHATNAFDERPEQWLKAKSPFLWFVAARVPDADPSPRDVELAWETIRLAEPVPAEKNYKSDVPPVFSMDFAVLKEPEAILAGARRFAKKHTEPLEIHTFTIPHAVAARCAAPGDANFLSVPVLPSLEKTARRMIAAPEKFLPEDHEPDSLATYQLRLGGVEALTYFKSDENIAVLKGLLDDPTEVTFVGPREGQKTQRFPIRASAFDILTEWGVDVPKPVVEVDLTADDADDRE